MPSCKVCPQEIELSEALVGSVIYCRGCHRRLAVGMNPEQGAGEEGLTLSLALCAECGARATAEDLCCTTCGTALLASDAEVAEQHRRIEQLRKQGRTAEQRRQSAELGDNVERASEVLLMLAVVFGTFGVVPELIATREGAVITSCAINLGLAVGFVALYFWSKRKPLPAVITALCIYLAVQIGDFLMDPRLLFSGAAVKLMVCSALLLGIRSALKRQPKRSS